MTKGYTARSHLCAMTCCWCRWMGIVGGRSEIRVSLEDEPGAVSGSKWLQAETRQHAANREPSLPSRCRTKGQLSSFVRGIQKAPEDHCQMMAFALVLRQSSPM